MNIEEKNMLEACEDCQGQGQKKRKLKKKTKLQYQQDLEVFQKNGSKGIPPTRPLRTTYPCSTCNGSGLTKTNYPTTLKSYPKIAIIGGGIGGIALAIACLHRGIPFTIYERDAAFNERSQGYGLTLQQASKAMKGFGIFSLPNGIVSNKHIVHNAKGEVLGEWGMRKWLNNISNSSNKQTNIHIARQELRSVLLEQLGGEKNIQWNHQLINLKTEKNNTIEFNVNGKTKIETADLVVGADGIRSTVRNKIIGEQLTPLRYLNCIVILGICPLSKLKDCKTDLLDGATVFQTANGIERIYVMPFNSDSVMWQLSFPIPENEAKKLSELGPKSLKNEAISRTKWHSPIPEIIKATESKNISGYPVYDRKLLSNEILKNANNVTLIGDAAHPMSPFKGQGANQALLDSLALARKITKLCGEKSNWREKGLRETVLQEFEQEMLARSAIKVKDSSEAAEFLHSEIVLKENNAPRGSKKIRNSKL